MSEDHRGACDTCTTPRTVSLEAAAKTTGLLLAQPALSTQLPRRPRIDGPDARRRISRACSGGVRTAPCPRAAGHDGAGTVL